MESEKIKKCVERTVEGDTKAFEELYTATNQRVYFICLHFLKNEYDAKDAVQDTYLSAYKNIRQLSEPSKFLSWVERIAVNVCKQIARKNTPVPVEDEVLFETLASDDELVLPEKYIVDKEKRKVLFEIMQKNLSDLQYRTIILYYFGNFTVSEIAEMMDCTEGAVKNRLATARTKIKKAVEKYQKDSDDNLFVFVGVPFLSKVFDEESKTLNAPSLNTAMLTDSEETMIKKAGGITMNKKILIGILAGVVAVGGITFAIIIASNSGSHQTFEPSVQDSKNSVISQAENSGSSDTNLSFQLTPHFNFKDKQGEVMQNGGCTNAQYDYVVLKDNTVWNYDSPSNQYTQVTALEDGSDEIVSKTVYSIGESGDHIVTFNTSDGKTKIYDKKGHSAVIPTTDFLMLRSNTESGIFNTYQINNGKLTVIVYDADGNILADEHDMTLYNQELKYFPAENIKGIYIYKNFYGILKNDGTMYFFTNLPLFTGEDEDKYELGVSEYFDIISDVKEPLSTDDSLEVFYTTINDEQFIYYTKTVFGYRNDHSGKCRLPDGYTASDVEKISSHSDVYMFMKDKTVFYIPEITESPSWKTVDIITDMNKSGELKSFRNVGLTKNVLKNDGTFYSLWVQKN